MLALCSASLPLQDGREGIAGRCGTRAGVAGPG